MSKKALKKQQKDAEKAAKKQHKQESQQAVETATSAEAVDTAADQYGNFPLIQSQEILKLNFVDVKEINTDKKDQMIWVRARLHTSRSVGEYFSGKNSQNIFNFVDH